MKEWRNQYLCEPWLKPNPVYQRLRDLILSYLTETEDYDQSVCTMRKGKLAMPANGEERRLIGHHASMCQQRYLQIAQEERLLNEYSWIKVRQQVEREWEATYVPPSMRLTGAEKPGIK